MLYIAGFLLIIMPVAATYIGKRLWQKHLDMLRQLAEVRAQRNDVVAFLNRFSRSLATEAAVQDALDLLAHRFCDALQADSLAIYRLVHDQHTDHKSLLCAAIAGLFPAMHNAPKAPFDSASQLIDYVRNQPLPIGDGVIGQVALTRHSILIDNTDQQYSQRQPLPSTVRNLIAVPMLSDHQVVGVVCAVNHRPKDLPFTHGNVRLLEELSGQAALACNLVSIYTELSAQHRLQQELRFARDIQASLLPDYIPDWEQYSIHATSRSAFEVGGDFYDFVQIDANRLMIVVGDASGKGVPASLLMAMCRSFVIAAADPLVSLEAFFTKLNRYVYNVTDRAHFVTMAAVILDRHSHTCHYASAGHPEVVLRLADGTIELRQCDGPALGMLPPDMVPSYSSASFTLAPGSSLYLVSDGITEALNKDANEFGISRLKQAIAHKLQTPSQDATAILDRVQQFSAGLNQSDDQTLVVIQRQATIPSRIAPASATA